MANEIKLFTTFVILFLLALLLSSLITKSLIKIEGKKRVEHQIHELIVDSHKLKKGTATLGGIGIFIPVIILSLIFIFNYYKTPRGSGLIFILGSYFFIGLFDDLKKLKERDERGLRPLIRILLEVGLTLMGLLIMGYSDKTRWGVSLPLSNSRIFLGFLQPILLTFIIVGASNANNLLDGLDGLSGGVTLFTLVPFVVSSLMIKDYLNVSFIMILMGAILGFLLFNIYPARIFMGDCGSLVLGAMIGLEAIYTDKLLELPLIGLIYVIECLSVILQVSYFKLTRKRIFKMAPLHHHFEMAGNDERRVVSYYYLGAFVLSLIGILLEVRL